MNTTAATRTFHLRLDLVPVLERRAQEEHVSLDEALNRLVEENDNHDDYWTLSPEKEAEYDQIIADVDAGIIPTSGPFNSVAELHEYLDSLEDEKSHH